MKNIWICPVCRTSSTRNWNLKEHIKNCHKGVDASPVGFDPLLREYAIQRPQDMTFYGESFRFGHKINKDTKNDNDEPLSSLRKKTRTLNELSDYGDALIRFKKHAPASIDPLILAILMSSQLYSNARTRDTNYSFQQAANSVEADSSLKQANVSGANIFRGFTGDICKTCWEVTVMVVPKFPPARTASEYHLAINKNCKERKLLAPLVQSMSSLQNELVDTLASCVKEGFEGKRYLYCKRLDIKENFWKGRQNQEAVEARMGIPAKVNRVEMINGKPDHWAVRAYKQGRTEIDESETVVFLRNAHATYAIFWAQLDGLPDYYFMWIDEEKPHLKMEGAEILRSLGT